MRGFLDAARREDDGVGGHIGKQRVEALRRFGRGQRAARREGGKVDAFDLVNSLIGYIILQCGTDVISIYIFLQFFENLSVSLDESAILDGCTYFGVFFKILFPLLRPAIVTVMILKGIGVYNEYYAANLYLQDKTRFVTVSTALYTFTGPFGNAYNLICAGVILTLIPMLVIFIACQKQIYSGLAAGSVKG